MNIVRSFALAFLACSFALGCAPESEEPMVQDTSPPEPSIEQLPHLGEVEIGDPAPWTDPNLADADELVLHGMSMDAAEALVAGRPYADMTAVDAVLAEHLDEAQRDTVYETVWMPIDLNTASAEEIELIPGVGERMRHEFEEYRPYRAIEEFRREIGKYVDEDEVARLERYVEMR